MLLNKIDREAVPPHDNNEYPPSSLQSSSLLLPKPNDPAANSEPRRTVTLPLLRKRSEHNGGLVSTLEEVALHQEDLHAIGTVLGRTCGKTLKILLLQNNVIERMEPTELKLFRNLEYLNLALNNISKIEGISSMEWLRKLDLTLNFLDVDALEESVDELSGCRSLEELYLLGNPCMGLDGDVPDIVATTADDGIHKIPPLPEKKLGWQGCREYIVARLSNLQSLDGKEIKRSERIVATQQIPLLTMELRMLADIRKENRQLQSQNQRRDGEDEIVDEGNTYGEAPTHHNPETRTKISNELHCQKRDKEKKQTAMMAPKPKGEKDWEEEHRDMVQQVRKREERGRQWESSSKDNVGGGRQKHDVGIKQCNQGKYRFWFEEDEQLPPKAKDGVKREPGNLIMRVAIPKHLSTSLVNVNVHPTYVSVVIKSKILRVILPLEVCSGGSLARRSAASGYLELIMPKANPNESAIGLGHVRGNLKEVVVGCSEGNQGSTVEEKVAAAKKVEKVQKKKNEHLGQSLMDEAAKFGCLKIVQKQELDEGCPFEDNDEEPPPLF